jgi:hypothetical protein
MIWTFPWLGVKGVRSTRKAAVRPPLKEYRNPLRERSTLEYSPPRFRARAAEEEAGKETASCGHTRAQVRHWMHSGRRVFLGFSSMAPMGQARTHLRHSLHSGLTLLLKRPRGERKLNRAPRGQRYRHQKRGTTRFRAMIPEKTRKVIRAM